MSRLFELHDRRGSRHLSGSDLPLTIGTGDEAHIQLLSGRSVEAYLGSSDSHLFLQPVPGATPVFHNDSVVSTSVWIKSGDTTRIGENILHYEIAGDRVVIRAAGQAHKPTIIPPATPHPDSRGNEAAGRPLPRVTDRDGKHPGRSRFLKLAGALLLLLLLAAGFTLAGHSLEITVTPKPDSLTLSGFPPVIHLGRSYFGLKGNYTVKAVKEGYQTLKKEVTIQNGTTNNRYSFTLDKMPGRIDLFTGTVTGARVFIDDTDIGETPLRQARIPAGEHQVLIQKERYLDFKTTLTVTGLDQEQRFDFELAPGWSDVTLTSKPPGAAVLIDNKEKGLTPLTLELLTGTHTILLQKKDFTDRIIKLEIPAGQTLLPEPVVLSPAPATLSLTTMPPGASVTADGVYMGTTPVELDLSAGEEHTLILGIRGYENLTRTLTLAPAESRSLNITLKPEFGTVFLTTDPPDAELYIDGKPYGKATGRFQLQTGKHTLELRARGYKTVRRGVTAARGYSRQVDIRLEPDKPTTTAAPKTAVTTREGKNVLLMEPATFKMGASRRDPGRRANERLRTVQITRPWYIGIKEVTNKEFRRFKPDHSSGSVSGISLNSDNQPVVNISWEEAARYLNWLSSKDGLEPFYVEKNGTLVPAEPMTTGYRLPFESEWSYAARLSNRNKTSRYPWSGTFPPPPHAGNFGDESARGILNIVIRGYNDSFPVTAPVAGFPRNPGGLFDIGGNVSEWCHDLYSPYSGFSTRTEIDPTGPVSGTHRVVRGSSWRDGSITELRLSYRAYSNRARDHIGFRIARFAR